jgi:tetratricopeptide (TPR) repeat protein
MGINKMPSNAIEHIYHEYCIDPAKGEVHWFEQLDRACENEDAESFNALISLEADFAISRTDSQAKVLLIRGRHAADLGRRQESEAFFGQALTLLTPKGKQGNSQRVQILKVHCLQLFGNLKSDQGELQKLISSAGKTVELFNMWANILDGIAHCQMVNGQLSDAVKLHKMALQKIDEILIDQPDSQKLLANKAGSLGGLARTYAAEQRIPEAIRAIQEAIEVLDKALLLGGSYRIALSNKGAVFIELANLQAELGSISEAENTYRESSGILLSVAYPNKSPKDLNNLGLSRQKLGELLLSVSSDEDALEAFNAATQAYDDALAVTPGDITCMNNKATCLRYAADVKVRRGDSQSAIPLYDQALDLLQDVLELSPNYLFSQTNIAAIRLAKAQAFIGERSFEQIINLARTAIEASDAIIEANPREILSRITKSIGHKIIGDMNLETGDPSGSIVHYESALEVLDGILQDFPKNIMALNNRAVILRNLAKVLRNTDMHDKAQELLEGSMRDLRNAIVFFPGRIDILVSQGTTLRDLAELYALQGKKGESRSAYESALSCFGETLSRSRQSDFHAIYNRAVTYISYVQAVKSWDGAAAAADIADKAIVDTEAAVKLRPHNKDVRFMRSMAYFLRGICAAETNDRDFARQCIKTSLQDVAHFLQLVPNHTQALQLKQHAESVLAGLVEL